MNRLILYLVCQITGIISLFAQFASEPANDYKLRFGGYGEILYQHLDYGPDRYNNPDGSQPDDRAIIGIPRIVFSFEYRFQNGFELVSELEIEHGGTGSALELEYEEAGEYEMEIEKAGEVALEQAFIRKIFSKHFQVKVGHIIVPVGRLNNYHLPVEYFGTIRPEGESQIIPTTWHETGIAINGDIKEWSYELQLINGLDANGFSRANWVKGGYQKLFEDIKATQMAGAFRLDNKSLPNTIISASGYYGKSTKNTSKPEKMDGLDGAVSIISGDFEFNNKRIISRGNVLYGHLSDSYEIGAVNQTLSKNIQYPRTPVAQNALTYSVELGYDVMTHFRRSGKLIPFLRYEYYNSMEKTSNGVLADARFKRDVYTFGINYFLLPGIAIKADYSTRLIDKGNYNTERILGLSLVYSTYFLINN